MQVEFSIDECAHEYEDGKSMKLELLRDAAYNKRVRITLGTTELTIDFMELLAVIEAFRAFNATASLEKA